MAVDPRMYAVLNAPENSSGADLGAIAASGVVVKVPVPLVLSLSVLVPGVPVVPCP